MTPNTLNSPKMASHGDKFSTVRAAGWLSLGAAPTFAFMAVITDIAGGGPHAMSGSSAPHTSVLGGMVVSYLLMSVFHLAPWLKLFSQWRSNARAHGLADESSM